jgi:Tol biopolymer transport system component
MKHAPPRTLLVVLTLAAIAGGVGCSSSSPTGATFTKVAFSSDRTVSPATSLFVMNLDGSSQTPVPFTDTSVYTPSITAAATVIAFDNNGTDLWTSNLAGTVQSKVASFAYGYASRFSPDGKQIVVQEQGSGKDGYDEWIMNADGTGALNLTSAMPAGTDGCYSASFSADSTKIVMICEGRSETGIYTIKADGTGLTTVYSYNDNNYSDTPAFSPDGTKVFYISYDLTPNGIYSVPVIGGTPTLVVPGPWESEVLNSMLYYTLYDSGLAKNRIYKANLDGTGAVALTDGTSNSQLATSTY